MSEDGWIRVAAVADVPEGSVIGLRVGDREIALCHVEDGDFFATDDICTHEYARLSDGWLEGTELECPLHAGKFDVCSGRALSPPAETALATFEVRVTGPDVFIKLS